MELDARGIEFGSANGCNVTMDRSTNKCEAHCGCVRKVGVRIKMNEKWISSKDEIELCIRKVREGKRGKEIMRNALRWKELAKEAMDEDGRSSYKNIDEFVTKLS